MLKNESNKWLPAVFLLIFTSCFQPTAADQEDSDGDNDGTPGTEFLFDPFRTSEFQVSLSRENWDRLNSDMVRYEERFGSLRTGGYYPASLDYSGPEGSLKLGTIGFRTRGNTTRRVPEPAPGTFQRAHFALKFNSTAFAASELKEGLWEFGEKPLHTPGTPEYKALNRQRLFGLRGINLKQAQEDAGVVREVYAYTFMNAAGIRAPRAGFARLKVIILEPDGARTEKDFGLYGMIEPVNKSFLSRHWGAAGNDGPLYKALWQQGGPTTLSRSSTALKADPSLLGLEDWTKNYRPSLDLASEDPRDYPPGTKPDHSLLYDFSDRLLTLSGAELKTFLDARFEIQPFLKWMAANLLLGMPDDYRAMGNNFFLYFPSGGGKASFIPYDYDHGLGGGWVPYDTAGVGIFEVPDLCGGFLGTSLSRPLVDKVLAIPDYRKAYVDYLEDLLDTHFVYSDTSPDTLDFLSFYSRIREISAGSRIWGLDSGPSTLAADPGVAGYFETRRTRTLVDIALARGEAPEPSESLVLIPGSGFSEKSPTVWAMAFPETGAGTFDFGLEVAGVSPAQVEFRIIPADFPNPASWEIPVITDDSPPFSGTFSAEFTKTLFTNPSDGNSRTQTAFSIQVTAFDAGGKELASKKWNRLWHPYADSYVSVQDLGNGNRTFRFKPSSPVYESILSGVTVEGVYLRGPLGGTGDEGWADVGEDRKMIPDREGIYEITLPAFPGEAYKFFVDHGNPDFPGNIWTGNWLTDLHNYRRNNDSDANSLVP